MYALRLQLPIKISGELIQRSQVLYIVIQKSANLRQATGLYLQKKHPIPTLAKQSFQN